MDIYQTYTNFSNATNVRSYANLMSYAQGKYGKGIVAPYFGSYGFRSNFKRGESNDPNIVFNRECCDSYAVFSGDKNAYVNQKIIRQKK